MPTSNDDLAAMLLMKSESLNVEFKGWLDPNSDVGIAKIAKACLALRNSDGGFLVIGVNDEGIPTPPKPSTGGPEIYNTDRIQEIISKYSSETFPITLHPLPHNGHDIVIIEIPPGIKTPVRAKRTIKQDTGENTGNPKVLIEEDCIYTRTLESNGRVSTSRASHTDLQYIMERCFNNRESDIGSFLRRQLSGIDISALIDNMHDKDSKRAEPSAEETLQSYRDICFNRYTERRKEDHSSPITTGTFEAAAILRGSVQDTEITMDFLRSLPRMTRHSGWPPFVAALNADRSIDILKFSESSVDAYISTRDPFGASIDFSRIESHCKLYHLEAFKDDLRSGLTPGTQLDFVLQTGRLTETVAALVFLAKQFAQDENSCTLDISVRWRGLRGRTLSSWADPSRSFWLNGKAAQDSVQSTTSIPLSIAADGIGLHVEQLIKPLFRLFGGWEFESIVIQDIVSNRLLHRF